MVSKEPVVFLSKELQEEAANIELVLVLHKELQEPVVSNEPAAIPSKELREEAASIELVWVLHKER